MLTLPGLRIYAIFSTMVTEWGSVLCPLQVWDLRKNAVLYKMSGHLDTVTGLCLSPDGSYVLSNSMDNTREQHE